jgi:diphthamide biosynthesis methyltransferase
MTFSVASGGCPLSAVSFMNIYEFGTTLAYSFASDEVKGTTYMKKFAENHTQGLAHCPICTHTVPAEIDLRGKYPRVMTGQKCPRCGSALDVAAVIQIPEAA